MNTAPPIRIATLRLDGIAEASIEPWSGLLDDTERDLAARFVFSRNRIEYVAAHVLMRSVLRAMLPGCPPATWRFVPGEHGKPELWIGDRSAPVSFNLSHTHGMVGVAAVAAAGCALGFDVEALDRAVTLEIADHYFCPEEVAWLYRQAPPDRMDGFLRLWTLKEAFIKATGEGLARDLASFWFEPMPPRLHLKGTPAEAADDWRFEQRILDGGFVAAVGVRQPGAMPAVFDWVEVDASHVQSPFG